MSNLNIEELIDLENAILEELPDKLTGVLSKVNRTNQLEILLNLLDLEHLLSPIDRIQAYNTGLIVVIGHSEVKERDLMAVGKSLGLDKKRFEFHLSYDAAKTLNYKKYEYEPKYCVILLGPVPHKTTGTGDGSSLISELENKHKYGDIPALVKRLTTAEGTLKITKTNFREVLNNLINDGIIAA